METNELRKGNQIKYHDKIITVAGIVRNTIYYESKELCFDSNIGEYKPFQPIQLTEEWLIKFGFELDYKSDYSISYGHIKNCKFSYKFNITENKSWLEYHGGAIECKYAHQLQNIYFALTGEELAIA